MYSGEEGEKKREKEEEKKTGGNWVLNQNDIVSVQSNDCFILTTYRLITPVNDRSSSAYR